MANMGMLQHAQTRSLQGRGSILDCRAIQERHIARPCSKHSGMDPVAAHAGAHAQGSLTSAQACRAQRRSCHAPGFGAACSCAASAACSAHVPPRRSRAAARACATSSRRPGFRCPAAGAGSGRGGVSTSALHAPCGMATRTCMFPAASKQRRVQCQIVSGRRPHVPAPPVQWSAFCSCSAAAWVTSVQPALYTVISSSLAECQRIRMQDMSAPKCCYWHVNTRAFCMYVRGQRCATAEASCLFVVICDGLGQVQVSVCKVLGCAICHPIFLLWGRLLGHCVHNVLPILFPQNLTERHQRLSAASTASTGQGV